VESEELHTVIINIMAEKKPTELSTASARSQRRALLGDDDATMVFETSKEVSVISNFDQMKLREDLLRGIYAYGTKLNIVSILVLTCTVLCVQDLRSLLLSSKELLSP